MFWTDKAKEAANEVIEACRNLPVVIGHMARLVARKQRPGVVSDTWSYRNRLLVALRGHSEARGYKPWLEVGRRVKKGEKAFYIMAPWLQVKAEDRVDPTEEDGKVLIGYRAVPVFGLEQTEPDEDWKEEPAYDPLFGETGGTIRVFNGYRQPWDQWYRAVRADSPDQLTALLGAALVAKLLDQPTELQDLLNTLKSYPAEEIAERIDAACRAVVAYMESGEDALANLRAMLSLRRPGPLPHGIAPTVEALLAQAWDQFSGDNAGMTDRKLCGGTESVVWQPPTLVFRIERHGAIALGSGRTEVREWAVDLERRTVSVKTFRRRQIRPAQGRLDVDAIAKILVDGILAGRTDEGLKWEGTGRVRVLMGKVLPTSSAAKATVAGRRRRLRQAVAEMLDRAGWRMIRANVFECEPPPDGSVLIQVLRR
jgi:hypothetical protein